MSNDYTIEINAITYVNTNKYKINYINTRASADAPILILTDSAGRIFYDINSAVANERHFCDNLNGQEVSGIKVGAFTGITRVIIGVSPVVN
jgi:hypothetical protein